VDGDSIVRNSLEAGMAGPMVQWEDEVDPGLVGDERARIDDRTD